MKHAYLEVTYRKGQAIAAYYYLPRGPGATSARVQRVEGGLLIDFDADGHAIGIEITSPASIDLTQLNDLLVSLGHEMVTHQDMTPLMAA